MRHPEIEREPGTPATASDGIHEMLVTDDSIRITEPHPSGWLAERTGRAAARFRFP